jgi:hypothetical protein
MGLFYSPFSNVCPFFILVRALGVLLGVGWFPSCIPTICELLDEIGFDCGRLGTIELAPTSYIPSLGVIWVLTVNVGSSGAADVDDSTTEEASVATEELASLRTD